MKLPEISMNNLGSFLGSIHPLNVEISNAKLGKPGEVPFPDKNPEIIPPGPPPITWPKKEPEIQPEREPLTIPPTAPPEVPKPPQSESGTLHFYNWLSANRG
ncbi:hypothetical protein [Chryseolinea sp. H1M3-3]|uniref:hypothetical protein n=1 Tax=Chryseolinea sp. H1M3-3 TaxID=3034144 RepID=UPI0023EA99B0|nr:hypothetical protein [Chryseolinea sp. H1M3-3]